VKRESEQAVDGIFALSPKDLGKFERIPERLHRKDPWFTPPFPGSVAKLFSAKAPYAAYCDMQPFVAYRGGAPVGRIAAVVNRAHNRHYQDRTGFFGFFDAIDDVSVARELVDRAAQWLGERGMTVLRGPYNPTVNDECGLLVDGFESIPSVMMPYNPPYYLRLYEAAGLVPVRTLKAFYIRRDVNAPERMFKIADRVRRVTGLTVRPIRLDRLEDELPILHKLYNATLDRNWGFVPLSLADLQFAASDLKAIVDPELVMIAEKDGVPAGFSVTIPNINEFLWEGRNLPVWLRPVHFLWRLKTRRPKIARLAILGVAPEFRGRGVAALFYVETLRRGGAKFEAGELSWVEENNEEIIKGITLMGGEVYKTYRIYERPIEGNV
jgi:GNAT superfamily N-acetyltransferase